MLSRQAGRVGRRERVESIETERGGLTIKEKNNQNFNDSNFNIIYINFGIVVSNNIHYNFMHMSVTKEHRYRK